MSSKKAPTSTQQAPSFFADPFVEKSQNLLFPIAEGLAKGRFMDPNDPTVGFLNELVKLNPEATKAAVGLASRDIEDTRRRAFQETINQLAANNQLESSVTANRLADLEKDFSSDISDVNTQFYLADVERTLGNIGGLFQTGLGVASDVRSGALANQDQRNQFEIANFQNRVAAEMLNKPVATRGGVRGAISGAIGGGIKGAMVGGPWGALIGAGLGGVAGGFGSPQTGGQIASLGALSAGLGRGGGMVAPGGAASDDPYGRYARLNSKSAGITSGSTLYDRYLWN